MEKYNIKSIQGLIKKTGELIDDDPLLGASNEIDSIKENFEAIHNAINNKSISETEKKWFISKVFWSWAKKDEGFRYKTFEWKINSIFKQYDLVFESVGNSIKMYLEYWAGLNLEINSLTTFLDNINEEELETNDLAQFRNYQVMLNNLKLNLGRIAMSKESAENLHRTMESWRPIFETLISSCMIEISWQRTIEASFQMLTTISGTVEAMSDKLTQSTIESSKIALETWTKPVLCAGKLNDNMLLLKWAVDELQKTKNLLLTNNNPKDEKLIEWE